MTSMMSEAGLGSPPQPDATRASDALGASFQSLMRVSEVECKMPGDRFKEDVDTVIVPNATWAEYVQQDCLPMLIQRAPSFPPLDSANLQSQGCLTLTSQPGPVFVASAHTPSGPFRIELLPHPHMPALALRTWKLSPLRVSLVHDSDDESKTGSKKRGRPTKAPLKVPKRRAMSTTFQREYPFDKLDITLTDLTFPASGCRPMRLEFACTVTDPLGRSATFSTSSNAFMIISNCNQWKEGLGICLRNFIFPDGANQAPFCRFFNFLHLAYLDSKGFAEARYLDSMEIKNWLLDAAAGEYRLERDLGLLEMHGVVTDDLFETWYEQAGPVFYDLHTSNVGKLFQKLWAAGFVGIGTHRYTPGESDDNPGHFRLNINTKPSDDNPHESYLVLQSKDSSYPLLALERDHLAYFFEHSRNSQGCTHLISATQPGKTLPIDHVFVPRPGAASSASSAMYFYTPTATSSRTTRK